eukprot:1869961-Amphidinium_carterae.1
MDSALLAELQKLGAVSGSTAGEKATTARWTEAVKTQLRLNYVECCKTSSLVPVLHVYSSDTTPIQTASSESIPGKDRAVR